MRPVLRFFFLTMSAFAATCAYGLDVEGHLQTTTWSAADSPYHITDTLTVPSGEVLTIEPGADVIFDANVPFVVEGTVVAQGTKTDSIRFLPGEIHVWKGLQIRQGGDANLRYVRVSGSNDEYSLHSGTPYYGGGVIVYGARLEMQHCVIRENQSEVAGGGIHAEESIVTLQDCHIVDNQAETRGGGIRLWSCRTQMERCVIGVNTGGGCSITGERASLIECVITGNTHDDSGAGLEVSEASVEVETTRICGNICSGSDELTSGATVTVSAVYTQADLVLIGCLISDNSVPYGVVVEAEHQAPAIVAESDVIVSFINSTICDNWYSEDRWRETGDLSTIMANNARIEMENSICRSNALTRAVGDVSDYNIAYCNLDTASAEMGSGNISLDPLFSNASPGDYSLQLDSPCIDTGSPYLLDNDGSRSDMGWTGGWVPNPLVSRIRVDEKAVYVSSACAGQIIIRNEGGAPLIVEDFVLPEGFVSATCFPQTIEPGQCLAVYMMLDASAGDTTATAVITHNDPWCDPVGIPLHGVRGTAVSGSVWGTWSQKGSPYRIVGRTIVPSSMDLLIQEGVDVFFETNSAFIVGGNFRVEGTAADSVRILSSTESGQGTLQISSPDSCNICYCRISNLCSISGAQENSVGISGVAVQLSDVVISGNSGSFVSVVTLSGSDVLLERVCISGNRFETDYAGSIIEICGDRAQMRDCVVTENSAYGGSVIHGYSGSIFMENCLIADNSGAQGITAAPGDYLEVCNCTVTENRQGVIASDRRIVIDGSIIYGNEYTDYFVSIQSEEENLYTVTFSDIGSWAIHKGAEEQSSDSEPFPGVETICVDPLFSEFSVGNYTLADDSPCENVGTPYRLDDDGSRADMGWEGGQGGRADIPHINIQQADVFVNAQTGGTFTIYNTGGANLVIDSVSFTPRFSTNMSFPQTIPSDSVLTVPLLFDPIGRADTTGQIRICHNDIYQNPVMYELSGLVPGTRISGKASGRWSVINSPYRVTGDIIVDSARMLEIEPGVQVLFDSTAAILVAGTIQALGTESDSIVFDLGTSDHWEGIALSGVGESQFSHCRFSGASYSDTYGKRSTGSLLSVDGEGCSVAIERSVVSSNMPNNFGIITGGLDACLAIRNCRIENNRLGSGYSNLFEFILCREIHVSNCVFVENSGGNHSIVFSACEIDTLVMDSCVFEGNELTSLLKLDETPATILGCRFQDNRTYSNDLVCVTTNMKIKMGHIVKSRLSPVRFEQCDFIGNKSDDIGMLIHIAGDSTNHVTFDGCRIEKNLSSDMAFAGIRIVNSSDPDLPPEQRRPFVHLVNSTITRNESWYYSTVLSASNAVVWMTNCTVSHNRGSRRRAYTEADSLLYRTVILRACAGRIVNCVFWDDRPTRIASFIGSDNPEYFPFSVRYSAIMGGYDGVGNISAYPMFADSANGDFSLLTGSPCIDAGDPDSPLDLDGTRCDIGAHTNINPVVDVEEEPVPLQLSLGSPFPNPFNPTVTMPFVVPETGHVGMTIYNIQGQVVRRLVNDVREAGAHQVMWNGRDEVGRAVASGVYLCRLTTMAGVRVRRMLLVR